MSQYYLGFDLGGTKLAWALVSSKGRLVLYESVPVFLSQDKNPHKTKKTIIDLMTDVAKDVGKRSIKSIGLASAGPMDMEKGLLIDPSNFKNWGTFPIVSNLKKSLAKKRLNTPIYFQNDAMAAALGEGWVGAAKGLTNYIVITLGTGIGTGVIFNGAPALSRGMGGEWGLSIIEGTQTVESIASGPAIVEQAYKMGFPGSSIEDIVLLILRGRDEYRKLFSNAAKALAVLSYNLSLGFHPQKIFFTGGLMGASEYFWEELNEYYSKLIRPRHLVFQAPLLKAKLGNKAGAIGAARLPLLLGKRF